VLVGQPAKNQAVTNVDRPDGLLPSWDAADPTTDEPHTGSYAVDASEVPSWTTQWRTQLKKPHLRPDPDARWNGKGDAWYGYWLHGVVRLDEVGVEAPSPCLVERIELTAANADVRVAGIELLTRMVADHERADELAGRPHRPAAT